MANIKERCTTLHNEFKSRMGYASISAIIVAAILIIVKNSAMPGADERIGTAIIAAYTTAAFAAHIAADVVSYVATGFSMQNIKAWQGALNAVLSTACTTAALSCIDMACAGGIFTIDGSNVASPAQIAISNLAIAAAAVTTSASFALGSEKRRKRAKTGNECSRINANIAERDAAKRNNTGLIIMNQIVNIDTHEGRNVEIAVCDMLYAHKADSRHVVVVYKPGMKTLRLSITGNMNELLHSFTGFGQVMRCHKDYIVNTDRVTHAQGLGCGNYELSLRGTKHTVPVSDKYRQAIYETLTAK